MEMKVGVQVLYYLSKKLNSELDKLKSLKLIFFADRYHLQKYGRLITDDNYFALPLGPIPSNIKDILTDDETFKDSGASKYIEKTGKNTYRAKNIDVQLDYLSETDIESLDFSIENFGKFKGSKLVNISHKYPEWKRFEETLKKNKSKREEIIMDDFFEDSDYDKDPFKEMDKEIVVISKEIFSFG